MGEQERERWRRAGQSATETPQAEALAAVEAALSRLSHGSVVLTVHDGRVVQLDVTEKHRFTQPRN